jgi:dethiobiotin synthetase
MSRYFITGIGTEVGKTVVAAICAQALGGFYWKPVQAGDLDNTDSIKVKNWTEGVKVLPEKYSLTEPMSPHAAAKVDSVRIEASSCVIPEEAIAGPLIVEGAGGVLVPLNEQETILDLIGFLALPVIIVSRNYLGSINHSLLTIASLQTKKIPIAGILFNGKENYETQSIILEHSGVPSLGRVPEVEEVSAEFVCEQAEFLRNAL